jgi:hypothetical protein
VPAAPSFYVYSSFQKQGILASFAENVLAMPFIRIVIVSFLCITLSKIAAQEGLAAPLPAKVNQSFQKKYPGSSLIDWESTAGMHKLYFLDAQKAYVEASFRKNGRWLNSQREIKQRDLPEQAIKMWNLEFPDVRYVSTIMELRRGCRQEYSVSFETSSQLANLVFDKNGKLLKKNLEPISFED